MPSVVLLGTGAAVTEAHRTTTMLGLAGSSDFVAVDCGGDLVQRVMAAGFDPASIRALILTHEHADHVSGFPLFMEKLWLYGRRAPIEVYGPEAALQQAERCFSTFDTSRWDGLPDILWFPVDPTEGAGVLECRDFAITAYPGRHGVPVIGIRVVSRQSGRAAAYSSDTEPCASMVNMATGADLLIFEATGERPGHSSASQAAEIALTAGVRRLVLVHIPDDLSLAALQTARDRFSRTEIGEELAVHSW